uniref:Uncharacterized protein n=1 Tax=Meloidogyne enterolobii TaxID=390850 RepID=A0A6V7VKE5_MELEN|nr:unnamed protein product [Meloidogyne enterolobii]
MNIYGIITGGDKQKIFYGISATNFQNRAKSKKPPTSGYNVNN